MKTALPELTSQPAPLLPPAHLESTDGTLTLSRAWPLPKDSEPLGSLAVELRGPEGIRAGWWRSGAFNLLAEGEDPKLRMLNRVVANGQDSQHTAVVSHRPGKRAVVRVDGSHGSTFIKVVKRGKASGILAGIQRAGSFDGPFRLPRVEEHTESTVTYSALGGVSLHDPSVLGPDSWERAWTETVEAWAESVRSPRGTESALVHRAEAEVGVLRHWLHMTWQYLEDADRTRHLIDDVSTKLLGLTEDRLVPAHRDLHDKQLMWSPQLGPGLLDVDTACLANPALDVGNLRAHSLLRELQGLWTAQQAEAVRFSLDETAETCHIPRHAVALYEQAAHLRLGLVYSVRPQYAEIAAHLRQHC